MKAVSRFGAKVFTEGAELTGVSSAHNAQLVFTIPSLKGLG
jgi:hypothetical protein